MRACAALAIAAVLLPQASPRDAARADLDRRREAVIRAYDLDRQRPRLDRFARIITRAFGDPALVRQAPLDRLPFVADNRREFLQRTAALVTARFGVRIPDLTIRFARLDSRTAGRVTRKGDAVTVEVADRNRDDDEEIAAVVAHEFAHIVLEAPGSGVPAAETDNEDLADATVVMAGLGPLMLRVSYREGLSGSGNRATWTVRRTGSLNPVAIAYLTLVQAELAGVDAESRRSLVGSWLEPAWSARAGR
jgi:hypothetical protein